MTSDPVINEAVPLADHQRAHVWRDWQYQIIGIEPACAEAEASLHLRTITTSDEASPEGYKLTLSSDSLLEHSRGIANAGAAPTVAFLLMQLGYNVTVTRPPVRRLAQPLACSNPHLANFVAGTSHGLVKHHLPFGDLVKACVDISVAMQDARIAFVASRSLDVERLHTALQEHFGVVSLASRSRCTNAGARLTVTTFAGLGHADVIADPFDILFFLDAAEAVMENRQIPILAHGRVRIFGFLREDQDLPPRIQDLLMAAFGPMEVSIPRLGHQNRHIETAWLRIAGPPISDGLTDYALYRRGVVAHGVRNRLIAQLARAMVIGDATAIQSICPAASHALIKPPCATAILVGTFGHAFELAHRLAGWPIIARSTVNLVGLSSSERWLFDSRRALPMDNRRAIVTVDGIEAIDLSKFDVAIWAAGYSGLPDVPSRHLICPSAEQHPLLWIDVRDGHHGLLRRASSLRSKAYDAAGWFPVGRLPVAERVRRFLADRPRGGS